MAWQNVRDTPRVAPNQTVLPPTSLGVTRLVEEQEVQPQLGNGDGADQQLKKARITKLLGFNVPQVLGYDDEMCVIEMSIVTRPFVLDFAGAYLDIPPDISEDAWDEWKEEKQEEFGARWLQVQAVLAALEELDIHMVDVSSRNIAFIG